MVQVFYNLKESIYKYKYNDFIFYFSSENRKNKFISRFKKYIEEENYKLNSKYKINLNYELMLIINFYKKIENRGFCIYYKNKELLENTNLEISISE